MEDLTFTISGQHIAATSRVVIASGTYGHLYASFAFSADWSGLTRTALFQLDSDPAQPVLLGDDNRCLIPQAALSHAGWLRVGVSGASDGVLTTVWADPITVRRGAVVDGSGTPEEATWYEQVTDVMEQQAVDAQAAQEAQEGAEEAEEGAVAAQGAAEGARDAAVVAQGQAEGSAQAAAGSASMAEGFAGDADDFATIAANNILNGVDTHNTSEAAHPDIRQAVQTAESIARGRATAYVFDTYADMTAWLAVPENVAGLVTGDNLYIRDTGVKDYWWDGSSPQELEAEAPDLTDYYTKVQVDAMMPITLARSAYDALVAAGTVEAGRTYDIYED